MKWDQISEHITPTMSPEELAQEEAYYKEWKLMIENCPNKANHDPMKLGEDGCLECGFYSK